MFRIGEEDGDDQLNKPEAEIALFGDFDDDDPDFLDVENVPLLPRPRSRVSSRNSSSSNLLKNMSNNNLVRFYLGTNSERHPSGSTKSSMESLNKDIDPLIINPPDVFWTRFGPKKLPSMEQCYSCCVRWDQDQFTFDCNECGGYAMDRECPECNGECNSKWKRDYKETHKRKRAVWTGTCNLAGSSVNSILSADGTNSNDNRRLSGTTDGPTEADESLVRKFKRM